MRCPECGDEYQPGIGTCADCGVALRPPGVPPPALPEQVLGVFHPLVAERITALLADRGITHRSTSGDDAVRVLVDDARRDELRTELTVGWREVIRRLPREDRLEVLSGGGRQPGWYDAPRGGWIDRSGRLRMSDEQEERTDDARRTVGPGLVGLGSVMLLFAWYADGPGLLVFVGITLLAAGLLLPR